MRISELVRQLEVAQEVHGDVFVENGEGTLVSFRVEPEGTDAQATRPQPVVVLD